LQLVKKALRQPSVEQMKISEKIYSGDDLTFDMRTITLR